MASPEPVYDLRNNMLRKMLIVGKTGTGKSTLCNRLAGLPHDAQLFPVSAGAVSCTQSTAFGNVCFGGSKERLVSLIDTIGFDDPNNDTDVKIIAELVDKLMNFCDKVNLFLIAVNGQNPRLDGSLVAMIKIFQEMFGEAFWKQCCIVFTRMPMDEKSIRKRKNNAKGKGDEELAQDYIKVVEDKFPQTKNKGLKYVFLDACYDEEDEDEEQKFNQAMEEVFKLVESNEGLPTKKINKEVETEHKKLKRELDAREKEKEEFTKKLEAINNQLQEAEANRHKDEKRYQEEKARLEKQMEDMKNNSGRLGGGFIDGLIGAIFPPAAPVLNLLSSGLGGAFGKAFKK